MSETALGDVRVLDLANEMGVYCTKLLADLGADVIKIEPPGGDPMRLREPFFHDEPHPEKSLYWLHFNTSKRSVTLNLETADGREMFKRLAKSADIVVETFPPGYLDRLGLGYSSLREINPRLIVCSITPFGQRGPYRSFKGGDLVGQCSGGQAHWLGYFDRPPVRHGCEQAYHQTSLQAAHGILAALYHRDETGEGQHIDVAMQECVVRGMQFSLNDYIMNKRTWGRTGIERSPWPGVPVRQVFPCRDGYVSLVSFDITAPGGRLRELIEWMDSEGMAGSLKENLETYIQNPVALDSDRVSVDEMVIDFFMKHTKDEIEKEGQRRGVLSAAVKDPRDVAEDEHLNARGYLVPIEHPELGATITDVGPPYRLSLTPWRISRRAPLVGEHNLDVYVKELGYSAEKMAALKGHGVI